MTTLFFLRARPRLVWASHAWRWLSTVDDRREHGPPWDFAERAGWCVLTMPADAYTIEVVP